MAYTARSTGALFDAVPQPQQRCLSIGFRSAEILPVLGGTHRAEQGLSLSAQAIQHVMGPLPESAAGSV
jgi:hypothetical protein